MNTIDPVKDIIPIHKLNERSSYGIEMFHFEANKSEKKHEAPLGAHRDDHYVFVFQEHGFSNFMLDFKPISIEGAGLICILPGQVHHIIEYKDVSGWFLAIDTLLVGEDYRKIFEQVILSYKTLIVNPDDLEKFKQCAGLLYSRYLVMSDNLSRQITHTLALSFIGMIAEGYMIEFPCGQQQNSRAVQINNQFRALLLLHFKSIKSPAAYAGKLNLSLTYLNEVIKGLTGSPVSYWIHHEVILEAKRLLYYSDLTVKEISFELGFSDHTYFSRLFTRVAGVSAGKFRNKYRQ